MFVNSIGDLIECGQLISSLVPRPFPPPVFHPFQYAVFHTASDEILGGGNGLGTRLIDPKATLKEFSFDDLQQVTDCLFPHAGDNAAWNEHITRKVYVWQNYFYNWLLNNVSKPILVVRFEDLKTDLIGQMKRMLDFVQLPYMEDDLRSRLSEGFDKFQRIHDGEDFKHFTAQQREFVKSVVLDTIKTLRLHGQKNMLLGLTDYLFTDL